MGHGRPRATLMGGSASRLVEHRQGADDGRRADEGRSGGRDRGAGSPEHRGGAADQPHDEDRAGGRSAPARPEEGDTGSRGQGAEHEADPDQERHLVVRSEPRDRQILESARDAIDDTVAHVEHG